MARRPRNVKAKRLHLALSPIPRRPGQRDDRDLPNFNAPRAGRHTRIPGRGSHKAKAK